MKKLPRISNGARKLIKLILGILILVFIFSAAAFYWLFLVSPEVASAVPKNESQDIKVRSEIKISFSRPVSRDTLIPQITPDVPGEWKYQDPYFIAPDFFYAFGAGKFFENHFYRALVFIPDQVLMPETDYKIELKGIKKILNIGDAKNYSFGFSTQTLPKVAEVIPKNKAKKVLPFSEIKIKLTQPNPELVDFEFILEPEIKFEAKLNEAKDEYALIPKGGFAQGVKYDLKVIGTFVVRDNKTSEVIFQDTPEELHSGFFETAPPPKISSFEPTGNSILTNKDIKIVFSDPMDDKSVKENFSIEPETKGDFSWSEDKKTLVFKPSPSLSFETDFKIKIKKGAKNAKGGYLPEDAAFSFRTIGRIWASFSIKNGAGGLNVKSPIKIYFNQSVDKESAKAHFKIAPSVSGSFSFSGNTMTFHPAGFSYQASYKATLSSGVKSVYGLDSNRAFSTSFTTASKTVKLSAPMDFQDYPLSCEAAALKMALAYKGVYVSEDKIMSYVGTDSSPRQGDIWGDPYNIYVGNISGRQNTTGYGVYWGPIAVAAKVWRPSSQSFAGWSISDLTKEIENGNPVVVWGVIGGGAYQDSWHTKDGKYIYAWKGEHARTAIGFIGSPSSPSKIIINDPWAGQLYWSTSGFLSNWNVFGRSGVVVR